MNAEQFAQTYGLRDGKRLRQVIRDKNLMPQHRHGEQYEITTTDAARLNEDPDVCRILALG
jgi:hypothetical protein